MRSLSSYTKGHTHKYLSVFDSSNSDKTNYNFVFTRYSLTIPHSHFSE